MSSGLAIAPMTTRSAARRTAAAVSAAGRVSQFMPCRPDRWLLGLPALLPIAGLSAWMSSPGIEAGLRRDIALISEPGAALVPGARLVVAGRDLTILSEGAPAEALREAARVRTARVPGLRRTIFSTELPTVSEPFTFSAVRTGSGLRLSGHVEPGEMRDSLAAAARGESGGLAVEEGLKAALGAPPGFGEAARYALSFAATLPDGRAELAGSAIRLSGSAEDASAYDAALRLARSPPVGFRIESVSVDPPLARPFRWSAAKTGTTLVLEGNVPTEQARAGLMAPGPQGGRAMDDRMRTARGIEAGIDFATLAATSLRWLDRLEAGRVSLDGRQLDVAGRTPARDMLPVLEQAIRTGIQGGAVTIARLDLGVIPASPFRFAAKRRAGRLSLTGYAPDEAARDAILAAAARWFPFEAVVSDVHVADGAPAAMAEAAELGLVRLSGLAEGEVSLSDRSVTLAGRALYPELAARMRREAERWPEGWSALVDIASVGAEKPLDREFCADLLADSGGREPVRFEPGRSELGPAGRKAVALLAAILRRCGAPPVRVVSTLESDGPPGSASELSARRAAAVAEALREGVAGATIRSEGLVRKPADPKAPAERISVEVGP